ncbi:PaaI family thioesterase [Flavobacteriaceae bacterium]|jgi:1,4-dihydroxy-2-naphthoyl-CoA hydrolase|nr:PaaI family thioesterase [Flavobacteriaceae bacterium]MDC1491952.1 PaaI family thioesterase [Flavobacteriaceae bacterium]
MLDNKDIILQEANKVCKNTLMETLNIELVDIGKDFLILKMPVNSKVYQPDGVLHGGATAALAESAGSMATYMLLKNSNYIVRGIEITANHLKSVKEGFVYAKATFIHKGRTTQLISINITDDSDNLISHCKLTTISLPKSK